MRAIIFINLFIVMMIAFGSSSCDNVNYYQSRPLMMPPPDYDDHNRPIIGNPFIKWKQAIRTLYHKLGGSPKIIKFIQCLGKQFFQECGQHIMTCCTTVNTVECMNMLPCGGQVVKTCWQLQQQQQQQHQQKLGYYGQSDYNYDDSDYYY
ncbi:uncharacterized protein LOC124498266 [Dermatophagoides farinae]|uniref:uncharacterized protein LOC124498266 n=1 Tax=Dermatophagoides farinae TaxID=6954 RepID=UPI003F5F3897